jgi:hypothetical protein
MIKTGSRRLALQTVALLVAQLLIFLPVLTEAKAKGGKAAKPKAAAKAEPKAEDKAEDKAESKTAETDTDADEIFTEDELTKTDKADKTAADDAEDVEPEEEAAAPEKKTDEEKSDEPTAASVDNTAAEEDVIEEDADLEVLSSSDEKKGFFPTEFDGDQAVRRDRGINILTARATRPMALTLVIDHRPHMKLASAEAEDVFFDYLGLDGYLKVGLGLRFGILEGLDVGLYRLNDGGAGDFDAYEFDVRYAFLKQEKHYVDMSARAGITWFVQKDKQDAVGGYGEVFIDHVFFNMLLVGAGFQFHSESSNDVKKNTDKNYSGAVLGVIEWRMIKQLALVAEVAASVVGYGSEYGNTNRPSFPGFSMGVKVLTHRHTFTLMVSNTQFINADGIVSNSWRDFSDIIFGFQIFREFNFK